MSELKAKHVVDVYDEYLSNPYNEAQVYLKSEADKVIAELEKNLDIYKRGWMENDKVNANQYAEIAKLKALAKEPFLSNRVCRKCGKEGTLMYTPTAEDNNTFWDLYNNKGIDYVFSIRCAHCGEVAFVTKQTHEYELRKQKYKRCLAIANGCKDKINYWHIRYTTAAGYDRSYEKWKHRLLIKWRNRWLEIAEKFKPNSTAQ